MHNRTSSPVSRPRKPRSVRAPAPDQAAQRWAEIVALARKHPGKQLTTLDLVRGLKRKKVFAGLDDKTRALICVVSDTCTGREPELALHLRMALRQGWTEDELIEVLLHLSGYIGVPIIRECMLAASKVFKEYRAETGKA